MPTRASGSENTVKRISPKTLYPRAGIALLVVLAIAAGVYLARGRDGVAQQGALSRRSSANTQSIPVLVAKSKTGAINRYLTGLGTVTPLNTVIIKSLVDGQLMRVSYREGQLLRARLLLAEIDHRPFQVQLSQAERKWAR